MQTISNPFKVNRLTNTIQSRNKSSSVLDTTTLTENIKLPALRAINKSVKYNNISFVTATDLNKLRQQPQQPDNIQQLSAHHSLYLIRKKFDSIYKEKEEFQKQIENLTAKRDRIINQKLKFQTDKKLGQIKVVELGQTLDGSKLHSEQADIQRKVMMNIISRLKEDKIIYDLRKFRYEKQLKFIKKQQEIIIKENSGKNEQGDRIKKVFVKLISHLEEQKKERQEHLKNYNMIINEKESLLQHDSERYAEILTVRQNAMQDKLPTEKNWYKLMLVTKFVSKLLSEKMNRQMSKFRLVQNAYKHIRTQTGIPNAQIFIQKFLKKDATYGDLLGKISINQKTIQKLKEQESSLLKQRYILQNQQDIINSNKKNSIILTKQQKQLHQYEQKSINCLMMRQKLKNMIKKYTKKIKKQQKINDLDKIQNNLVQNLKFMLQGIVKIMKDIEDIQISDNFKPSSDLKLKNNVRISFQEEQNSHAKKQQQNHEEDYINSQRQSVLKNNEKFMKELKKKYEDIKKVQLDAEPKKKELPVPQKIKIIVEQKAQ